MKRHLFTGSRPWANKQLAMDSILWQVLNVLLHETFVFDLFHIVYTIRLYS